MIKPWWTWAFWVSPLSYGQRAISVNEFGATRWMEKYVLGNGSVGDNVLQLHGLPTDDYWYWLGVAVLIANAILFNIVVTLALAYLNPLGKVQAVIPVATKENSDSISGSNQTSKQTRISIEIENAKKGMILPFQQLYMTFHNVNYFVDTPKGMKDIPEKKLQLLSNVLNLFWLISYEPQINVFMAM